jgi:hypothetical protein
MKRGLLLAGVISIVSVSAFTSLASAGQGAKQVTCCKASFHGVLSVGQVVTHPRGALGHTRGDFYANLRGSTLSWSITYRNLTTSLIKADINSGPSGTNGPRLVVLCPHYCSSPQAEGVNAGSVPTTGKALGVTILTKPQIDAMVANKTYVNVLTQMNPKGEIRGQIKRTK